MAIEIIEEVIRYQAKTKLLELALDVAESKNLKKVEDKIDQGAKIFQWCQALDYGGYLEKSERDIIVRALVDIAEIHELPVAPYLGNIDPPAILTGIPGRKGDTGAAGAEGGGVPFSATNVTIDTVCDSFPATDSRGVEYEVNIYDDTAGAMRIMTLRAGWTADGSTYADTGGIGETIVGDCSGVSLSVIVESGTVKLFATVTSGSWVIEGTRKYVPNNGNGIVNPTTLASGRVWIGNASNTPTAVAISGDISITSAGVTSIASGVIVNADISSSAAIGLSKLQSLTASKAVVTDSSGILTTSTATATEVGHLTGVTSNIQTQLDSKLSSASGAISTVVNTNLTADKVVISNPLGKIAVSSTTSTELANLSGVTSNIQSQFNDKVSVTGDIMSGALIINSTLDVSDGIKSAPGSAPYLKTTVIDIGEWNMDSTSGLNVTASAITASKIRSVFATIRPDIGSPLGDAYYSIEYAGNAPIWAASGSDTLIGLTRTATGLFDSTSFDATSYNRGWITIIYTS